MGSVASWMLIDNDARSYQVRIGDTGYWPSRMRGLLFSAVYSTQFEIGPISEATLGLSPTKQGWVDLAVTPAVGFAWQLTEDVIDEFVIRRVERGGRAGWTRVVRTLLTPSRTLSNLAGLQAPWHRPDRGLLEEYEIAKRGSRP
jgi:hypothetical protein